MNLPNTTVNVSSVLSRSLPSGSAAFGFACGTGAACCCGVALVAIGVLTPLGCGGSCPAR